MWHKISVVAKTHRLDPDLLSSFAVANSSIYGIVDEGRGPEVSTWYVDGLLRDFKGSKGLLESDRP